MAFTICFFERLRYTVSGLRKQQHNKGNDMFDPERQELEDEFNAQYGDPRHCPAHPMVQTSSGCGQFDAPCGLCESEMDEFDTVDPDWTPPTKAEIDADYDAQRAEFFGEEETPF